VIGDICLDEYMKGEVRKVSEEAPVCVLNYKNSTFFLGMASNVANNIKSLGGIPYLVSVIGDDETGRTLIKILEENNISSKGIFIDNSRITTHNIKIMALGRQHLPQHILRIDKEDDFPLSKSIKDNIKDYLKEIIDEIEVMILSDYLRGFFDDDLIKFCLKLGINKSKIILVDSRRSLLRFKGAHIMIPNENELSNTLRKKIKTREDIIKLGRILLEKLNLKALFVTCGSEGIFLFLKNYFKQFPTLARKILDITGAGDTVIASSSIGIANRMKLEDIAIFANISAAISISKEGTSTVTLEEIAQF
jgi:rfaE bifunctional protein kinase chain/domain